MHDNKAMNNLNRKRQNTTFLINQKNHDNASVEFYFIRIFSSVCTHNFMVCYTI